MEILWHTVWPKPTKFDHFTPSCWSPSRSTYRFLLEQWSHTYARHRLLKRQGHSLRTRGTLHGPRGFTSRWDKWMVSDGVARIPSQKKKQDEAHEPECRHVCWQTETIVICHISSKLTSETPWVHTLTWHFCRTPLLDTIAQRSGETLLLDTLVRHSCKTLLAWHSYLTLLLDILVTYLTLLPGTFVRHSYLTLLTWHFLLGTLVRHSYLTLL